MSTVATPSAPTATMTDEVVLKSTESRESRAHRRSMGVLLLVIGVLMAYLVTQTSGTAQFALSNAFDEVQLPTFSLPGVPVVLISAVVLLVAGGLMIARRLPGSWPALLGTLAGLATGVGFLTWAAAGRGLPFQLSNQLAGTIMLATPLILGALCGIMCERAGIVNVAIEGQMLVAAFTAAVVGSTTKSITFAIIGAVIAGVLMAAMLALFTIKYLVDHVVLGVVINLFASGLTGFLFDQLVRPRSGELNSAPTMQSVPIPVLSEIPFVGPVLFSQTVLVYLAGIAVVVVWFVLFKTTWGLRIRSVGEHPKAADTVGINVFGIQWSAVLFGGVFAGLGGAFFTVGSIGAFNKDITVGNGFIALAAVIMGRWHPVFAALIALFFGFVTQMATQLQTLSTPMPSQFLLMLPYVATIIAVAGLVGRVRAPAHDGTAYVK
ncbi:ABC transporter permease [Tessaracoccus sp. SD287]|uniref:ABC transporter permease n=1 Tax=Tessaracoccus sp. SD287 TaxID=2782008 RepID=UPI001A961238|nr:ABC transporter permease [Tessaracoccus sp. SD287]